MLDAGAGGALADETDDRDVRDSRRQLDPGIKDDRHRRVADAGADAFVAGSAIFGQPDRAGVVGEPGAEPRHAG